MVSKKNKIKNLITEVYDSCDKRILPKGINYILGNALITVGQGEQKLGQIEKDFIGTAANCYVHPLRKFLDGEMKTVSKELAILENKR